MNELTPGERTVRCFIGEPVDRVPFGVGLGWIPWGETKARWRRESGIADLEPGSFTRCEMSFAQPTLEYGCFPQFPTETISEDREFVIFRDGRGIVMRQRRDYGSMPEFLEHPVKSPADWERLKAERLQPGNKGRIRTDWDKFRAKIKQTGQAVEVGAFPWGVFGTVRDLLGTEETLMAFYDHPDMVRDMMQTLTGLWIEVYEQVAREVQIDHIHIWEDMSGRQGSLISPAMVEEFMMPCYDRIADFAQAHGVRLISVDTDGDCSELVPVMMRHGVNMMFPFEVQAGNDILDYRRKYPTLGITGGLDKRALAGTRADIDREVAKAEAMIRLGRYIPGFDHLIPPDVSWDNFVYAADRIRAVCHAARG